MEILAAPLGGMPHHPFTPMKFSTRTSLAWLLVGAVVALSGCAVPPNQHAGGRHPAASSAATGENAAQASNEVTTALRRSGDKWLLSLGHTSRVADIGNLTNPRVVHAARVGNATAVMLRVDWQGCDNAYVFVGIPANPKQKVDRVRFDHACSAVQPVIQTGHSEQFIDFIIGNRVKRYIYSGQELEKDREVVLRPGQKLPPPPGADGQVMDRTQRYRPGLAFHPTAQQLQERPQAGSVAAAPAAAVPVPASKAASKEAQDTRAATLPGTMVFDDSKHKDQKPILVDLTP